MVVSFCRDLIPAVKNSLQLQLCVTIIEPHGMMAKYLPLQLLVLLQWVGKVQHATQQSIFIGSALFALFPQAWFGVGSYQMTHLLQQHLSCNKVTILQLHSPCQRHLRQKLLVLQEMENIYSPICRFVLFVLWDTDRYIKGALHQYYMPESISQSQGVLLSL